MGQNMVIILGGEMLVAAEPFVRPNIHPIIIVRGYNYLLKEALSICKKLATKVDVHRKEDLEEDCEEDCEEELVAKLLVVVKAMVLVAMVLVAMMFVFMVRVSMLLNALAPH